MSHISLSRDEAEEIYLTPKYIESNAVIVWETHGDNPKELTLPLSTDEGIPLRIRGWYSWKDHKNRYGFSLLYRNNIVIRRWDDKKGHLDPITKKRTTGGHKHYHHPEYGDACSYDTNDVRIGDINGALTDFLKECNVSLEGATFQQVI